MKSVTLSLKYAIAILLTCLLALVTAQAGETKSGEDDLKQNFINPPNSARPWVFWFPVNGNLSKEGITADLESMARVGIGGALYMEVEQGAPQGKADFAGPLWREMFQHACKEAARLGLEINMNNDAGWTGSGGPWITPELSMQKVVWSDTIVDGGQKIDIKLPQPISIQNYYRDIAVLAMPALAGEGKKLSDFGAKFTSSGTEVNPGVFKLTKPADEQKDYVTAEFPEPFTAHSLTVSVKGENASVVLQTSEDGKNFQNVPAVRFDRYAIELFFPPVTARFFRVEMTRPNNSQSKDMEVSNFNLGSDYRINDFYGKAGLEVRKVPPLPGTFPPLKPSQTISRDQILDISSHMDANGKLTWDAPPGRWLILRFGYTTTGKANHPAPRGGLGLECDKFSKQAAKVHFEGLMAKLIAENKALTGPGKTLVSTHIDSWEVGAQSWTPQMREEFKNRRGYDLLKFLPAITGRVVDNLETSERFLWDLRKCFSDMLLENYAGEMRRLANEQGLRLSIEGYSGVNTDELAYGCEADEPMAEFWDYTWRKSPRMKEAYSCISMPSSAHISGKKIVGAEAFTSSNEEKWLAHPASIKDLGDWAFCEGINRFVFHRFAAQPWNNVAPGMGMGPWGVHYERTQTWWEQSKPWHEYLARCQHLLRQGLFVADVLYLQPEGVPHRFAPPDDAWAGPNIRGGYNFDGCTIDVLLNRLSVKDGKLELPDGMSYRVLVVPPVQTMTPRVVRRLKELHEQGATIVADANPPTKSPSLADMGEGDETVKKLAAELWPKLVTGKTPAQLLGERGIKPDFSSNPLLRHIHRATADADIYFLANPEKYAVDAMAEFRVTGKQPELWWPDTGRTAPAVMFEEKDGVTRVPLSFEPNGSMFVVFQKPVDAAKQVVSITQDGKELLPQPTESISQPPDVSKTFTLVAWVKPDADTGLPNEENNGFGAVALRHNYVLYPAPGHEVWTDTDAGAGLAVGRNGVTVIEHGTSHMPAVLVYAAPITKWTHIAVVYRDGTPSLYVDGKLVRSGLKSALTVHGGVGVSHKRAVPPFQGQSAGLQQFARALTDAEILKLAQATPRTETRDELQGFNFATGEIQQSGTYVFKSANGQERELKVELPPPQEITGPWEVTFDPKWGGPAQPVTFEKLQDWSKCEDPKIRYYSGCATYRTKFQARKGACILDLGKVAVMAEVTLNCKPLGILWKQPFRLDVRDAIQDGENTLEVKVVNLWVNRLIGDEQLPDDPERKADGTLSAWPQWLLEGKPSPTGRVSFSMIRLWKKDDPLVESGLLGPVKLQPIQEKPTKP